jgi:formylglycine-generating enzyme required for sulfatase activity
LALAAALVAAPALAQPGGWVDPASGIEFVRITHPGNAPWTGPSLYNNNRGGVDYVYSIGRFEVTTAQWAEFMNAALDRPAGDAIPHVVAPYVWGAVGATPNNPGRPRFAVPAGNEMLPTGGITWRTAAIYCNWLHNGKSTDREAFLSGAYDVSTFGYYLGGSTFTDQLTRSEGARYWIPSLDEWMKAAHWDPSKVNPDGTTGGWWEYSNGSDTPFVYGPPGISVDGQPTNANAGWSDFSFPGFNPYAVPLGAYSDAISPWGLLDVAGATSEWTVGYRQLSFEMYPRSRILEGSAWTAPNVAGDRVGVTGATTFPTLPSMDFGFRVASSVPAPGAFSLGVGAILISVRRYRRTENEPQSHTRNVGVRHRARRGRWHRGRHADRATEIGGSASISVPA